MLNWVGILCLLDYATSLGLAYFVSGRETGLQSSVDRIYAQHGEFPGIKGFSARNLLYMKQFAESYSVNVINRFIEIENELKTQDVISQQAVAKLLNVSNARFSISQQVVAKLADHADIS